ncbi:MAG: YraN family protein [Gammaproteobacteria bacterium]|nr:MAG: YraN family protein [Gammaproteobacteria bacterium]
MDFFRKNSKKETGDSGEKLAQTKLKKHGLTLVNKNYRAKIGEIDLIMRDSDYIVFVEVRVRLNNRYASGAESVTYRKQQKIIKTAQLFLQQNPKYADMPARFDVVDIASGNNMEEYRIDWIKNAFQIESV